MWILGRSTNKISAISALLAGLAIVAMGAPARAQTIPDGTYDYTLSTALTLPNSGYYAKVTVSTLSSTDVQITLSMNNGFGLHETSGSQHYAFYFNLANNNIPLTLSNVMLNGQPLTNNFALVQNPSNPPPFNGTAFGWAISFSCSATSCNTSAGLTGTISFDIKTSGSNTISLVPGNGTYNNQLLYFAGDLIDTSNGNTGNAAVPSPH